MAKRSAVGPTFTVAGIWWVVTAYFAPSYSWHGFLNITWLVFTGCSLGIAAAMLTVIVQRMGYKGVIAPGELRGLRSSIGEVPCPMPPPARANSMPAISPVTAPDIPADFVDNWLDEFSASQPEHTALFKAIIQVLNHEPDLPATHVPGGHGGRSLLQHSLLTAHIMSEVARTWRYEGLRDRTGKRVILPLRNAAYSFNPHDPMVAIIGLAHDLGKIEAYVRDHRGMVTGIRSEHDLTGSRMIARMEEAWAIPKEDRDALFLAIAHYHHPIELPLAPDKRPVDDRTIALMELLIRADFTVARIEYDGRIPDESEYQAQDRVRVFSADQLYNDFVALIHEANRINSGNTRYSIGQISPAPDGKLPMLYLHEDSLRHHLLHKVGIGDTPKLGNGKYQLTENLLNVLHARGILYTQHEGKTFSAGNAMWVCDVLGSKGQKIATWPCVIGVKLDSFDRLRELGLFSSSIKILHCRFGDHQARNKGQTSREPVFLGNPDAASDIPNAPKAKPRKAPPAAVPESKPFVKSNAPSPAPAPVSPLNQEPELTQAPAGPESTEPAPLATPEPVDHGVDPVAAAAQTTDAAPAEIPEEPSTGGIGDTKRIELALRHIVQLGKDGTVKCKVGDGCIVFNLETLSKTPMLRADLDVPGFLDTVREGGVAGATLLPMGSITLLSISPPILTS